MGVHGVLYCVLYERTLAFVGNTHIPGFAGWGSGMAFRSRGAI